jgi:hypothetical protein
MRLNHVAAAVTISVAALAASATPASATFAFFTSRSVFDVQGPITTIDWGDFGPDGTLIITPDSRTVGPVTVQVASSQGELSRHDEGTSYTGDFALGDHLLTDAGSESDSFIVAFASPVRGFGTQMEAHYITGPWKGAIELFDTSDTLLATILTGGTKGSAEDNSAPFYGVISSTANISFAVFLVDQQFDPNLPSKSGAVAINDLQVLGTPVPEPSSLAVFCAALMGLAGLGFVRRRAVA